MGLYQRLRINNSVQQVAPSRALAIVVIGIIVLSVFSLLSHTANAVEGPINVSNSDDPSINVQEAITSDKLYLVWQDGPFGSPDILFSNSTDGGSTFGTAINVSNTDGSSSFPQIAAIGSN